jgi:hypothetical protein
MKNLTTYTSLSHTHTHRFSWGSIHIWTITQQLNLYRIKKSYEQAHPCEFCHLYLNILPLDPIHVMLDGDGLDTWRTMPHNYPYPGLNPHWKWKQPRMPVLWNSYFQLPTSATYMDIILCNKHFHINFILTENENWELQHLTKRMPTLTCQASKH